MKTIDLQDNQKNEWLLYDIPPNKDLLKNTTTTDEVINNVTKDRINPKIELGKSTGYLNPNFGSIPNSNLDHSIDNVIGTVVKGRTVPHIYSTVFHRELIEHLKKEEIRNSHNELKAELNSTSDSKTIKSTKKMKL